MREQLPRRSPLPGLVVLVLTFLVAAGVGALANFAWVDLAPPLSLGAVLLGLALLLVLYLLAVRRRYRRVAKRRPLEDLFRELEEARRKTTAAPAQDAEAAAPSEPDSGLSAPDPAPESRDRAPEEPA